jgi:rare lipoprotein A (RlpA)-like double-psi beta-barrel protein
MKYTSFAGISGCSRLKKLRKIGGFRRFEPARHASCGTPGCTHERCIDQLTTTEELAMFLLQQLNRRIDLTQLLGKWSGLLIVSLLGQSCTSVATMSRVNIPYAEPDALRVKAAPTGEAQIQKVDLVNAPQPASKHALRGEASWYGPGFHGKKTASGEIYDQMKLTAAHKTLPLGTKTRVTNVENGNTVQVEINDRGPFVQGRVIDLSRAAARVLGFIQSGTAPVRLELVDEASEISSR